MRKILILALAALFLGAACGSSDSDQPAANEGAAPTTAAPTTEASPPPTTAAPAPTTEVAPAPTTAAPTPTTTEAPPPTVGEAPLALALPGAVEGTLLEGQTPEGFDDLQLASTTPRPETCPGVPNFGGIAPVAYSDAVWAKDPLTGPFLDVSIARFDSDEAASQGFSSYRDDIVVCGKFPDPATGAVGEFSMGEDPVLGDESYGLDYTATVQGLPVNRYGVVVRVGDSIYSAGATHVYVAPDVATVMEALNTFLGQ